MIELWLLPSAQTTVDRNMLDFRRQNQDLHYYLKQNKDNGNDK